MAEFLVSMLPLFIYQLIMAWPAYMLARRTERNGILWAILCVIPLIGTIFSIWILYTSLIYALDRVQGVSPRL